MNATPGALLFARYAYPPNALGLCGADSSRTLLDYGSAGASDRGLAELARTFEGAWPYLELIAACNRIDDPLDPRVVEAYWVGNRLLDQVDPGRLVRHLDDRFRGRLGRSRERVVQAVVEGAVPHHCFHVFAVYPWLGLIRSGIVEEPLTVLDRCRTSHALVEEVDGDELTVWRSPLRYREGKLLLGEPEPQRVRWREEGLSFVPRPRPGERVATHWEFVCDILSPAAASQLEAVTRRALAAVNGPGRPGERRPRTLARRSASRSAGLREQTSAGERQRPEEA